MPTYSLELSLFSLLNDSTSDFEIWADNVKLGSGYIVSSTGTSISLPSVSFSGSLPTSLQFRFYDAAPVSLDRIKIQSVIINNKVVNTGNFLSTATLNDGGIATVNIAASHFIFNASEPLLTEFTVGATRTLTAGDDRLLLLTSITDEIFDALGGRDYIITGSGNDKINGNAGDDYVRGGAGNDLLFGDSGNDRLYGDDGNDTIYGGTGHDSLYGNNGNDELYGGDGNDQLFGHDGNDILVGGIGNDKLSGGNGNDYLFGDDGDDSLVGDAGDDTLDGGAGNDILFGGAGNDILDGQGGNDTLVGDTGNDVINGGAGNDTLYGDNIMRVIGQAGQVSTNQTGPTQWHSITFDATIINPIIKLSMNTRNDTDPITLRVRNVTNTGFEWQIDEWDYLDGVHGTEKISWLAIASGTHTLDNGVVIQAGLTTATNQNNVNVVFNTPFTGSAPVVVSQVMTYNEASAVTIHNESKTLTGFQLHMEEQESNSTAHATETIGWIAIKAGGSVAGNFLVNQTGNTVDHNFDTLNFGSSFFSNTPVTIYDVQTENGGDPITVRGRNLTASSFDVHVEEEQSNDSEVTHVNESVGYFVTTAGVIYADTPNGNDRLNGGAGLDILYGGDGADTFIFEAASAYADTDRIMDFRYAQGDVIDISDLLTGTFSGTIGDYIRFVNSGTDTLVQVDSNGLTGGSNYLTIASLDGINDLNVASLYTNGNIVI